MFGLQDLFMAGLALDICGAIILARALLLSPEQISSLSGSYWDYSSIDAVSRARDKVDARFGLGSLVAGFSLQMAGYAAQVLWSPDEDTGFAATITALGIAGTVAVAIYAIRHWTREGMLLRELPKIALAGPDDGEGWTQAKAARLLHMGQTAGYEAQPEERDSKVLYMKRVFGIDLPEHVA